MLCPLETGLDASDRRAVKSTSPSPPCRRRGYCWRARRAGLARFDTSVWSDELCGIDHAPQRNDAGRWRQAQTAAALADELEAIGVVEDQHPQRRKVVDDALRR
jgi:hypothetical protein